MLSKKVVVTQYVGAKGEMFDESKEAEDSLMTEWLYKNASNYDYDFRKLLQSCAEDEDRRQWILGVLGGEG